MNVFQGGGGGTPRRVKASPSNPLTAASRAIGRAAGAPSAAASRVGSAFSHLGSEVHQGLDAAKLITTGYDPRIAHGVTGMVNSQRRRRRS